MKINLVMKKPWLIRPRLGKDTILDRGIRRAFPENLSYHTNFDRNIRRPLTSLPSCVQPNVVRGEISK